MTLAMTPPTSSVENCAAPRAPPIAWPILGNTYANTKINSNGCITVRPRNIQISLRRTARSRNNSAPNAVRDDDFRRTRRATEVMTFGSTPRAASHSVGSAFVSLSELPSGQADEDGLERRLLDAHV